MALSVTQNRQFTASEQVTSTKLNDIASDVTITGIPNSSLDTITTAGKVSGAALTLLANIPAAAGAIPTANLTAVNKRVVVLKVIGDADNLSTGDGQVYFTCPVELNGMNLITVGASVLTASTSGTPTIQIARGRRTAANGALSYSDMLSTRMTIDQDEFDTANAATAAVIDTTKDDIVVSTYVDVLRIDVDVAGTGTVGCEVRMTFQTP